jgi:hypothetical protein
MKADRSLARHLLRTKFVWLWAAVILVVVLVDGVTQRAHSPESISKVIAAGTPQPAETAAALDYALAPSFPAPEPGLAEALAALPELGSLDDAPSLPTSRLAQTGPVSLSPGNAEAWTCTDLAWQNCWLYLGQSPTFCYIDHNKRALVMLLNYPQYRSQVPVNVLPAWIYYRFWQWDAGSGVWLRGEWGPGFYQEAYSNAGSNATLFRSTIIDLNQNWVGGPPPFQMPLLLAGLAGPSWFAIEQYVVLSRLNESNLVFQQFVPFSNGSLLCGSNFSSFGLAPAAPAEAPVLVASAPTPPAGGQPPSFTFLPILVRPAGSSPAPTATPQPTPNWPGPPTPSSPPTLGNMVNADFEAGGNVGWMEYSSQGYTVVQAGPKGFSARSGQYLAWLGGAHDDVSSISQVVTVPASHPYLSLYLMGTSQEESCHYDRATIFVDAYHVGSIGLCKERNFHSWLRSQIDLNAFAGQTVTLKIQMETDASLLSSVFVDDLSFESGVLVPTPAPTQTPVPTDGTIKNPGFELGDNGDWKSYTQSGSSNIFLNSGAHSGNWLAWLGGTHQEVGYIEQTLTIPTDRPYLTYWGWISSEEPTCGGDYVWFLAGNTALYGYNLCAPYNNTAWGQGWVNLTAYAGTTQHIRIQVQTNSTLLSSLYVDDFAFAAAPPSASLSAPVDAQAAGGRTPVGATDGIPASGPVPVREHEEKEPIR